MPKLAHGLLARVNAPFDNVVDALDKISEASNLYLEVLSVKPRAAIAIGEKYFLRAGNALVATTIVVEETSSSTLVKIIASGGRESLLFDFDWGSSRDYTHIILDEIASLLNASTEIISEVDYLDKDKAKSLHT